MARNWAKNLKWKVKYLLYYEKMKKDKLLPQPYNTWLKAQRTIKDIGGGARSQKQVGMLSPGDAAEIAKKFGNKK